MKIGKREVERRIQHFQDVCKDAGVKLTHQRLEIFREVAQTGDHPDAEKVFQGVRKRMPTVSLDTVYRTLWMLNDVGLIRTIGASRERTRFDANLSDHHHFVCRKCGKMIDFAADSLDDLHTPDVVNTYGLIESTHVEIRGVCHKCASRQ